MCAGASASAEPCAQERVRMEEQREQQRLDNIAARFREEQKARQLKLASLRHAFAPTPSATGSGNSWSVGGSGSWRICTSRAG